MVRMFRICLLFILLVPVPALAEQAPLKCRQVAKSLLQYLMDASKNISNDLEAQNRWLSQALRKELQESVKRCKEEAARRPDERVDIPSNDDFLSAWDPPTSYRIVGSRRYGEIAVVDIEFYWGAQTNYPGDKRIVAYIFKFEDGAWRLDDLYVYRATYASPFSLSNTLRSMPLD